MNIFSIFVYLSVELKVYISNILLLVYTALLVWGHGGLFCNCSAVFCLSEEIKPVILQWAVYVTESFHMWCLNIEKYELFENWSERFKRKSQTLCVCMWIWDWMREIQNTNMYIFCGCVLINMSHKYSHNSSDYVFNIVAQFLVHMRKTGYK